LAIFGIFIYGLNRRLEPTVSLFHWSMGRTIDQWRTLVRNSPIYKWGGTKRHLDFRVALTSVFVSGLRSSVFGAPLFSGKSISKFKVVLEPPHLLTYEHMSPLLAGCDFLYLFEEYLS
jgi:hypothetical protein